MNDAEDTTDVRGPLSAALENARRLLGDHPDLALEQAREILKASPTHPAASFLLGAALSRRGDHEAAYKTFENVIALNPKWAAAHFESGLCLASLNKSQAAIRAVERALSLNLEMTNVWRVLGDRFSLEGDANAADRAYERHIKSATKDPALLAAATALVEGKIAVAERALRDYLKRHPTDVMAIRMLAEVAARIGRYGDSEILLERCLELAPSFTAARHNLAIIRLRLNKAEAALEEVNELIGADPKNPNFRTLRCSALVRVGEYDDAIRDYEALLKEYPRQPKSWMSFGHALKTVGRTQDSISAYIKAIELAPHLGEAYWSLANLKTYRFDENAVAAMRAQLERSDLEDEDRLHLHFALGKALEDHAKYRESFEHYLKGNEMGERRVDYDEDETAMRLDRSTRTFTKALFESRKGQGCPAGDPIFIVGMPRAGSTLIEQILSSHPLVEGTMELPDIMAIAKRLGGKTKTSSESHYPEIVESLTAEDLRGLGEEYLTRTQIQRKTNKPYFIDKMPNNFAHIGLIRMILPNAKIIDARRHPIACCFSGFKQHFAHGQNFTYGLQRIGRYYHDYVLLMQHYDEVLPGVVHRISYEELVAGAEIEIRKMLDFCGLEFDAACLSFHETERAVRTASSEQVRQPIYAGGVDQWRYYDEWLGDLRSALGDVLAAYPS